MIKGIMRRTAAGESGQFTLEATLVFPLILLVCCALLFFSMAMYRSAQLEFAADAAAERSAANWDNSYKDPQTGSYPLGKGDGLYWRTSASEWSALFGLSGGKSSKLTLPTASGSSFNQQKLSQAATGLSPDISGEMEYRNSFIVRSVRVQLEQQGHMPGFVMQLLPRSVSTGQAVSFVTEPAEFIRNLELFVDYASRLKSYLGRDDGGQEGLESFAEEKPPPFIDTEEKAKKYIQETYNSKTPDHIDTKPVGDRREYDAIDADGVAHDAKYTIYKAEAFKQIAKDAELMRRGEIKGCVWHFFNYKKSNRQFLTASIRAELERNGIIYVIHDL